MRHSKNSIQIALLSALLVLMGGCSRISQKKQQPTQEMPDQSASIIADCIVNYFQKDYVPYVTQQQHRFNPKTGYLKIVATEPTGRYTFTLNKDHFASAKQPSSFLSDLPASFVNEPLATAVFYSFTAGAGLLDTTPFETQETIKIEGQWYEPMQAAANNTGIQATILRNKGTNKTDLIKLQDTEHEIQWLLKSYNLRYSKELDTLVPMKIDVFDISKGLASKQLIIQFEYKSILKKQAQHTAE
ncbi:MAG: hypothetical protein ISS71_03745 [Phycisphaerae bacterium]|nr:hypothetical protein [Phycisphaerae bacterium]